MHGYPDDHRVWHGVADDLAADHRFVTYDVRGAGASDAPAARAGYRLDRLAEDLAAVLDAVSPDRPVHLLGHDWGAIQAWHAVTDPGFAARVASFTSISGPCLDHLADWFRRAPRAVTLRQAAKSWYTLLFRMPVLPELGWRSGLFGRAAARSQRMPPPVVRDAVNGLELYRANIAATMAAPAIRRTGRARAGARAAPRQLRLRGARSAAPRRSPTTSRCGRSTAGTGWCGTGPSWSPTPVRAFVRGRSLRR